MAPSPVCLLLNLTGVVEIGGPCAAFDWYDMVLQPLSCRNEPAGVPILRCVLMLFWEMFQLSTNGG